MLVPQLFQIAQGGAIIFAVVVAFCNEQEGVVYIFRVPVFAYKLSRLINSLGIGGDLLAADLFGLVGDAGLPRLGIIGFCIIESIVVCTTRCKKGRG